MHVICTYSINADSKCSMAIVAKSHGKSKMCKISQDKDKETFMRLCIIKKLNVRLAQR